MAQRTRLRGLLVSISSTSGNKHMEFTNRDFNAAISTRRCAMLKTIPDGQTRSNFVEQPLRHKINNEKMKPIADSRSKQTGRRLRVDFHLHSMVLRHSFLSH